MSYHQPVPRPSGARGRQSSQYSHYSTAPQSAGRAASGHPAGSQKSYPRSKPAVVLMQAKPFYKSWLFWIFVVLTALVVSALLIDVEGYIETALEPPPSQVEETVEHAPQGPRIETEGPLEALTTGQQNAAREAMSLLDSEIFSQRGLIEHLELEGYSTEDATAAVDYLIVDWNDQAERCAEDYLRFIPFTREQLIDQLRFEGFTQEQAEHGVAAAGL